MYVYLYRYMYTIYPRTLIKNNPIHLPSIHPGSSQPPMFWMFWCQKNCRLYSEGISWWKPADLGCAWCVCFTYQNLPTKNSPALSFIRDKVSLKTPWLHLPQHHGTTIHHHWVSRGKVPLKTDDSQTHAMGPVLGFLRWLWNLSGFDLYYIICWRHSDDSDGWSKNMYRIYNYTPIHTYCIHIQILYIYIQ